MPEPVTAVRIERPVQPVTLIPVPFACRACKHELRGLGFDAPCPGCAQPVRSSLPAGAALRFYKLTPELAKHFARGTIVRVMAKVFGTFAVIGVVAIASLGTRLEVWMPFVIALIAMSIMSVVLLGKATRDFTGYLLVVGDDEVLNRSLGNPDLQLKRGQVVAVQDVPGWSMVLCGPSRQFQVTVPAAMEGFHELHEQLSAWAPRQGRWGPAFQYAPTAIAVAAAILGAAVGTQAHAPALALGGGAVCIGGCAAYCWQIYYNPSHTTRRRWMLIGFIALCALRMAYVIGSKVMG